MYGVIGSLSFITSHVGVDVCIAEVCRRGDGWVCLMPAPRVTCALRAVIMWRWMLMTRCVVLRALSCRCLLAVALFIVVVVQVCG